MRKEIVISCAVIVIITLVASFFIILITYNMFDEQCQKGSVTDKYILPRLSGEPIYYLVLDNKSDVRTTEECYYSFDIGDYYNPCNR